MMNVRTWAILVMLAVLPALAEARERQFIGAEQDHSMAAAGSSSCEDFYSVTFTSFPEQVSDQAQYELPAGSSSGFTVAAAREGGVAVRGWNRQDARLVVCRYAVADTRERASRVLGAVHVSHARGKIAATGPVIDERQAWWVNMTLYVPRTATVDVQGANGGVAIRNMSGRVSARTLAGGISIAQSSGACDVTSESGGITLDQLTGTVEASSHKGSIAFKVAGSLPSIDAQTTSDGHIQCNLADCVTRNDAWTANRTRLRIGRGKPEVRLTTAGASIFIGPSSS